MRLLMTGPVVVDVPAADVSSRYVAVLIDSCTTGMHSLALCVEGPENAGATAVAFFSWVGPAHDQARVNVGLRVEGTARWRSRLLSFLPEDPEIERWRTVGFAVATLVGEAFSAAKFGDKPEPERRPEAAEPTPEATTVVREPERQPRVDERSWVDAEFTTNRGAQGFWPAEGGVLRFTRTLGADAGRWFADGAIACSVQWLNVDGISLVRPSVSAGGGAVLLRLGDFAVGFRADATVELVSVAGRDPATGSADHGERWWVGFRERIDASWMWSSHVGLVAGVAAVEMTSPALVQAHGSSVARISQLDFAADVGLRLAFR
ncbi:MAG: hypothetical protein WBY94_29275 [Polyangiaceae bacterium]